MQPPAFALSGVPRILEASAELAAAQGDDGGGTLVPNENVIRRDRL